MFLFQSFHSAKLSTSMTRGFASAMCLSVGLLAASVAGAQDADCVFKDELTAGESRLGIQAQAGAGDCFELTIHETGWVLVTLQSNVPATLGLLPLSDPTTRPVDESPDSLFFATTPGIYRLRASPEDPRESLSHYRLSSSFFGISRVKPLHLVGLLDGEEDDGGIEIVIDPFADSCHWSTPAEADQDGQGEEHDDGIEIVIDPFAPPCAATIQTRHGEQGDAGERGEEDDDGIEIVIDPSAARSLPPSLEAALEPLREEVIAQLCSGLGHDDHGDTFLCASPLILEQSADGLIGDGLDSRDLFSFHLSERTAITLEVQAEEDSAQLTLFDAHGQAMDRAGRRLVRTLIAGRYFVGVSPETSDPEQGETLYDLTLARR